MQSRSLGVSTVSTAGDGITDSSVSVRLCVCIGALYQNLLCTTLVPIWSKQRSTLRSLPSLCRSVLEFATDSLKHQQQTPL